MRAGLAFSQEVAKGVLHDDAAPRFTYMDQGERPWRVEYSRGGETLGIEVDLMEWALSRRWTHDGPLGFPMLESPVARQSGNGLVAVGDAVVTCGHHPAWLFAAPAQDLWAAGYHGVPAPFTLTVPGGRVEIEAMGTGTVVWEKGKVTAEAIGLQGQPVITKP